MGGQMIHAHIPNHGLVSVEGCAVSESGTNKPKTSMANDRQIAGKHYKTAIEVWDFLVANEVPWLEGNIIKYVFRHKRKGGIEDLKKAQHYLEKLMEVTNGR